jgi:hypothetical protein
MDCKRKRPVGVWVVTIFVVLSTLFTAFSFYAVFSGKISIPPAQQAYLATLTPLDHVVTL